MRDLIPRYTILKTLGESGKAIVYRASSEALGRDVALKVSRGLADDRDGRALFGREYAAICALRHPAIVDLYDYGIHGGREYLAMEYFPRGDLRKRLDRPLAPRESIQFAGSIAEALHVVHDAGLLHRDLKPANVMLRDTDQIVLIDFGLARDVEGGLRSTTTGVLRGSPFYMSPEQALGEDLDARSDLYSLGVIFYEMLTGERPYGGRSAIEVLELHVHAPVPKLPESSRRFQPLIDRLLAKSRHERPADASSVMAALARLSKDV